MIKFTRGGMSTVVEKIGKAPLLANVPELEARAFMNERNSSEPSADPPTESPPQTPTVDLRPAKKGDLVQWNSGGVDQFKEPLTIDRTKGGFAFFKGSDTGAPIKELVIISKEGDG